MAPAPMMKMRLNDSPTMNLCGNECQAYVSMPQLFLEFKLFFNALTDFFFGSPQLGPQEANHGFSITDVSP
jgi:hypothetical protein